MKRYKRITMIVTVRVPLRMSAAEARLEVKTLISEQCNYSYDCDDVRAVGCKPYSNATAIKQLGESTKMLRQLRRYASYIRNQVMLQHMGGKKKKPEFTYIDLDTLDEVSVICMLNCQAMEKMGVSPQALQHYLKSGSTKES